MSRLFGRGRPDRELPRPRPLTALLGVLALVAWLIGLGGLLWAVGAWRGESDLTLLDRAAGLAIFAGGLLAGAVALGVARLVKYVFSAAVSAKLTERNLGNALQREGDQATTEAAGASHEEVISLLAEITENTLLGEEEKAPKRQLAKRRRRQALRREIEALTSAGNYRGAQERLEEFRARYADAAEVAELEAQLSAALREHEQTQITQVSDQIHRYMGLGLWERAMEMAAELAEQYPENPEAARLPETVRLEQQATRRLDRQRLYREIEHLASRRHWRQALRAAETLLQNHPESPEANTLRDQVDELRRNAAIVERREWEDRITEHVLTGRHREAYDLAVELMEKYPDSPQAAAIRERLDQLKARAGVAE